MDGQQALSPAEYDFEGYRDVGGQISVNGEVRLAPEILKDLSVHQRLQLQTDGGKIFNLRFSRRRLPLACDIAHVDLIGDLSGIASWTR